MGESAVGLMDDQVINREVHVSLVIILSLGADDDGC